MREVLFSWDFIDVVLLVGAIITRGPGLSMVESTAILPEGLSSPQGSGLYVDSQIEPLRKIVEYAHSQNQKIGIQLKHSGRKASGSAPWLTTNGATSSAEVGGWPDNIWGPSDLPSGAGHPKPKSATKEYIRRVVDGYAASAMRAVRAGVDVVEIRKNSPFFVMKFVELMRATR